MSLIYRNYDQATLDAQYRARGRIANYDDYLRRWTADSEAFRDGARAILDVRYGPSADETLDVFLTDQQGAPVHVFFHGGYWQSLSNKEFEYLAADYVAAGAVWVAVNYTLCPGVTLTELVRQCRAAVEFVRLKAWSWGGNPDRIFISGHSAGGHLTALLLGTSWQGQGLPVGLIKGGVAISGLYDLEPIRLSWVNDKLGLDATEAHALSPIHNIPEAAGPLVVAVGGDESEEFHRQQDELVARWHAPTRAVEVVALPGLHHFSVLDDYGSARGRLGRAALAQMGLR